MKLEVVHLSDFHMTKDFDFKGYIDKIIDSLIIDDSSFSNEIVLCITGDLTQTGSEAEFSCFEQFLSLLETKIIERKRRLIIYFVPGNHDIHLEIDNFRIDKIRKSISDGSYQNILEEDIDKMNCFFNLSKKYDLFNNNNYICIKSLDVNGEKVQFNLLNTACFSSREKDDKELHIIPSEDLNLIQSTDGFSITLMHHSIEWFNEKSEYPLEKVLNTSSMYLFGHQHKNDSLIRIKSLGFIATEVNQYDLKKSPFNIYCLDFDNFTIKQINVKYYEVEKKYIRENVVDSGVNFPVNIYHNKKLINKFTQRNNSIEIDSENIFFDDAFVMPFISTDDYCSITSIESLMEYISDNNRIIIKGDSRSGKSTLIKKIYNNLILNAKKYVLFEDDLSILTNNFDTSIKHIFMDNYDELAIEGFYQEQVENRVLLLDSVNINDKKQINFINKCKDFFGTIIFTSDLKYSNRVELLHENLMNDYKKIKIEPFTLMQRNSFVEKLSRYYNQLEHKEDINKCLDSTINDSVLIDLTNPENISMLISNIIKNRLYEERDTKDSFTIMFEHNLVSKIKKNIGESDIDAALTILYEIAYFMFNKSEDCYKTTYSEICAIVEDSKKEWGLKIKIQSFMNMLVNSKIMKEENDIYYFYKNSYYSFFVAKKLTRKISANESVNNDILKLTNQITFGNYSDILLFLAYLVNNVNFFENIMNLINEITKDWEKLSFDKKNHFILRKKVKEGTIFQEKYESRDSHNKRRDKQERSIINKKQKETHEARYKEVIDDDFNKAIRVMKLIEILAKAISGYSGIIKVSQRKKMIETTKRAIYSLIYKVFDFSVEEYDELCQKQEKINNEKKDDKKLESEELNNLIINIFYHSMTIFTLNMITKIANIMVSTNSIDIIQSIKEYDSDGNIMFDEVLFKIICLERFGKEGVFVDYIKSVYDDIRNIDYKKMISKVFSLFVITSNLSYSNVKNICKLMNLNLEKILFLNKNNNKELFALSKRIGER